MREQIVSNLPILGPVYKLLRLVSEKLRRIQAIIDNFSDALCNAADLDANKVRQNLVAFLRNSLDGIIDVINNQIRLDAFLEPLQRAIGQIKDSVQRVTIDPLALAIANALTAILGGVTTGGGGSGNNTSDPCEGYATVNFRRTRIPNIVANIRAALAAGKPRILHRVTDEDQIDANRAAACGSVFCPASGDPATHNSCDEYPFASSVEGGSDARTKCVPLTENNSQGATLRNFYANNNINDGDVYCVKTTNL